MRRPPPCGEVVTTAGLPHPSVRQILDNKYGSVLRKVKAAAAAAKGAGAEALETGACPGTSTGRGGKKPPSPAELSMAD